MKLEKKIELVLILIISVLCFILLLSLIRKLRSIAPWRVNCWFCNSNVWVKFPERNSWTCQKCEQYNGFTADGDYNKQLYTSKEHNVIAKVQTPKVFKRSPPKNGLCKMCNINQQLKVVQLASFVPVSEKRFDEEIDVYRSQLEKAYKLCSPCRNVVQMKLHKEKESLLGFKLIESRTPEKKLRHDKQQKVARNSLEMLRTVVTVILFTSILLDCSINLYNNRHLPPTLVNMKEIGKGVFERCYNIIRMKALTTYPELENYIDNIQFDLPLKLNATFEFDSNFDEVNKMTQKVLGGLACVFQILGHLLDLNSWRAFVIDFLFLMLVGVDIRPEILAAPFIVSLIKFGAVSAVLLLSKGPKPPKPPTIVLRSPTNKLKNLSKTIMSKLDDDSASSASDDDVSLNKFGINHLTDSSNENLNGTFAKSRQFEPRPTEIIWNKPKLNSSFSCNASVASCNTLFSKPTFSNYQSLGGESDSDLDESISSLYIGSPKKHRAARPASSVFALRQFSAAPGFLAPRARPLISPSKLGHSWVAGGYWGADGAPLGDVDGSRSSSQSSGFESQASSVQRLAASPSSREASVCREPDGGPVFPQLQFNSHVHIPQLIQPDAFRRLSASRQHDYVQKNMFKAPGGSRLIKLPQMGSFSTN